MDSLLVIIFSARAAIILLLLIIVVAKKKKSPSKVISTKTREIITNLGGEDNITTIVGSISKIKFQLKDVKLVNKEALQRLGASGFIESSSALTIIFGKVSNELAVDIKKVVKL